MRWSDALNTAEAAAMCRTLLAQAPGMRAALDTLGFRLDGQQVRVTPPAWAARLRKAQLRKRKHASRALQRRSITVRGGAGACRAARAQASALLKKYDVEGAGELSEEQFCKLVEEVQQFNKKRGASYV